MKKHICRRFTLYHDKYISLFPQEDSFLDEIKKDYITIGFFDWFDTEKIIDYSDNCNWGLKNLYEKNLKLNSNVSKFQSFQNIYGFREDEFDEQKGNSYDNSFWNNTPSDFPLTFISFFQFAHYDSNIEKQIHDILNDYIKNKLIKFVIYYTLDKNDFIVCFKAKEYKVVIKAINYLYEKLNTRFRENASSENTISYIYTHLAVNYNFLKNEDDYKSILNEKIDSICIKAIFNNNVKKVIDLNKKLDLLCDELAKVLYENEAEKKKNNKDVICYEILGDTDCRFIAREAPLGKVLKLFSEKNLLNNNNEIFKSCFLSSMTSLNILLDSNNDGGNYENFKSNYIPLTAPQKTDSLYEDLNNLKQGNEQSPLIMQLKNIINYIAFLELQGSEKYEFSLLYSTVKTILKILNCRVRKTSFDDIENDELYSYINDIYTNILGSMRTDIRFFHISDYGIMSYNAPTKLWVFYSYLINRISIYYSSMCQLDETLSYDFIVIPTNNIVTSVRQIWRNDLDEDKLMVVYVSEEDFYDVKNLFFQLAHEVAHFVGNERIRKREKRFSLMMQFIFFKLYESVTKTIKDSLNAHFCDLCIDEYLPKFNEVYKFVKNRLDTGIDELIEEMIKNKRIKSREYFFFLNNIYNYMETLISEEIMTYFTSILLNLLIEKLKENLFNYYDIKKIREIIDNVEKIKEKLKIDYSKFKIKCFETGENQGYYLSIESMMRECYSDLSAVIAVDVSVKSLFNIVFNTLPSDDSFEYETNSLFVRACIVTKVLYDLYRNGYECIINSSYNKLFSENYKWEYGDERKDRVIKACNAILDNKKEEYYVYLYIKTCAIAQCQKIMDTQKNEENTKVKENREKLKKIYNSIYESSLMESIKAINENVEEISKNS